MPLPLTKGAGAAGTSCRRNGEAGAMGRSSRRRGVGGGDGSWALAPVEADDGVEKTDES